ncbi:hypothetical protein NJ76_23180 [Rhodococcus sp. IITR03]|nr:hypothetical protein NJ76_23180 [Rhodococcus sp. IITR03]
MQSPRDLPIGHSLCDQFQYSDLMLSQQPFPLPQRQALGGTLKRITTHDSRLSFENCTQSGSKLFEPGSFRDIARSTSVKTAIDDIFGARGTHDDHHRAGSRFDQRVAQPVTRHVRQPKVGQKQLRTLFSLNGQRLCARADFRNNIDRRIGERTQHAS